MTIDDDVAKAMWSVEIASPCRIETVGAYLERELGLEQKHFVPLAQAARHALCATVLVGDELDELFSSNCEPSPAMKRAKDRYKQLLRERSGHAAPDKAG